MIKIVILKGGIGNQLFQYCLYRYLEGKGHKVYYKDETHMHMSHYGIELDKYFKVKITPIPLLLYLCLKPFWHFFPQKYKSVTATDKDYDESRLFFDGYWHNKKFLKSTIGIQFKDLTLNDKNKLVLEKIHKTKSISLHVRRGDYLHPNCASIFQGICTLDYYQKAIEISKQKFTSPYFFIFSDDIEWCKNNLDIANCCYVDWNTGNNSIFDMFLMSHCKANILANSTFSYWAARISKNNLVVYPKKWFANKPAPDMFPMKWIGI